MARACAPTCAPSVWDELTSMMTSIDRRAFVKVLSSTAEMGRRFLTRRVFLCAAPALVTGATSYFDIGAAWRRHGSGLLTRQFRAGDILVIRGHVVCSPAITQHYVKCGDHFVLTPFTSVFREQVLVPEVI